MSYPENTRKKSVFVCEAQSIFRLGLRHFIREDLDLEIVGETEKLRGASEEILDLSPDLVILEIAFPDGNGLELIKTLRGAMFDGSILVLSNLDESLYAERSLRAGANGYVMKSEDTEQIRKAVHTVLQKEVHVSESLNARLLKRVSSGGSNGVQTRIDRLTDREIQVLELIGAGLKTRSIAERLSISSKTVDTHRINIRQKLAIPDVNELIRFAVHWCSAKV
jgi:DNA-binding NarL/FixJ family response regulator